MGPATGALISGGLKLLGGLFGSKKKSPTPRDNLLSQAQGAREAADKYGFNPLTMLQYGQTSGAMGGGVPPLASTEFLMGALDDFTDAFSGEAAQRAEANRLELELGKIKLEQLRAGGVQARLSAASSVGDGASPLGPRAATVGSSTGVAAPRLSYGNSVTGDRPVQTEPVSNSAGFFEIENEWTGGGPIVIPGDGDPWGVDELVTAVTVGVPQVAGNIGKRLQPVIFGERPGPQHSMLLNLDKFHAGWVEEKDRVPREKRRDIRDWPWKGLNPFSESYMPAR